MSTVGVRVPASSANLGAGFDCVGLAVGRWLELTASLTPSAGGVRIERRGTLSDLEVQPENDRVWVAFAAACRAAGRPVPGGLLVRAASEIPVARGLGSSAAATVAGALAANALLLLELDDSRLLGVCEEVEGHPDNVAAALHGGATLALAERSGALKVAHLEVNPGLAFAFAVPDFPVETRRARQVLPPSVALRTATGTLARAGALVLGLTRGDPELLALGMDDRLHVPWRRGLIPGYDAVVSAARREGAYGATLSGSGSSIVAVCAHQHAPGVAHAMAEAWRRAGVRVESIVAHGAAAGSSVTEQHQTAGV
jgi:homoserine kinase